MSGLCGNVLRAYLDPEGLWPPEDYSAGWFGPYGPRDRAHYFPEGTAHSACWRWERPELWPTPHPAPSGPACARCAARWERDQRRAAQHAAWRARWALAEDARGLTPAAEGR